MTPPAQRPRRILMTADAVGGVWHYALTLAAGLHEAGVGTVLAVMGPPPSAAQQVAAQRQGIDLRQAPFRLEWMDDSDEDVERAGAWLLELERELAPDLVHINGFAHAALPWSAPTVLVAHSCVSSWWSATKSDPLPDVWDSYIARLRLGLAAADLVVAPTQAYLRQLQSLYGRRDRARVIRNGRDPHRYAPNFKQPFILAAGRIWDEAKNLAALDRVAPRLPWPVMVAGDTTSPDGRTHRCDNLRMLGALDNDDLAEVMGRAAIFASPAHYEPFGLAALEAAMSGCALVLSDIPSLRELWHDAALFVTPGEDDDLASALLMLCENPDLLHALAKSGWARARRYSASRMVGSYLDAYADLLYRVHHATVAEEHIAFSN
jgi:glycosyltransferase involved in cell wall biosynthesis